MLGQQCWVPNVLDPVQAQRSAAVKVANRREQAGYAAQQAALESAMAAARADIVACKAEREEARKIKRQKEEYEVRIVSSQLWAHVCSLLCHSVLQCKSAMSMAGNNQHCPGCVWQSKSSLSLVRTEPFQTGCTLTHLQTGLQDQATCRQDAF